MSELKTKDYIKNAIIKHGNKYDYSLLGKNINSRSKIKIICPIHGIFIQEVRSHISNGSGCPKCSNKKNAEKLTMNNKHFEIKSKKIHGNIYDYSLVNYKNAKENVKIICKKHGIFEQTPSNHYKGFGCPKCGKIRTSNKLVKSNKQFLIDANKVHGDEYDYTFVDYKNAREKIKIRCKKHGIFEQTPNKHLNGQGCPKCRKSQGEKNIIKILTKKNIKYITQKKFNDCRDQNELPFDFYLPDYNMCIEYDGIQHFKSIEYWGGNNNLKYIKKHDQIKNNFCQKNNIKLLRIKYNENIENKLERI